MFREANEDESGFTCCAFSARERFLMLGTCTGQLKLYNVFSGQEEASYNCHNSAITHLEPSRVRIPRLFSVILLRWVGELLACGLAVNLYINFFWNIAMLIRLCMVCGCFYATVAELSSCDTDQMAYKAQCIYCLALQIKVYQSSSKMGRCV